MVSLKPVTRKDALSIIRLTVNRNQRRFVASNLRSLLDARRCRKAHGFVFPFGIYNGGVPVGFVMIGYGTDDEWYDPPGPAEGNYSLWRLMIDKRYQGRGYGREALELALKFVRSLPCGPAELCWLSFAPDNEAARRLYRSFGFRETGEKDGDELIAVLKL